MTTTDEAWQPNLQKIQTALTAAFPDTRFWVLLCQDPPSKIIFYLVRWYAGPSENDVSDIADRFCSGIQYDHRQHARDA